MAPRAYTSLRGLTSCIQPWACSGAMNPGVPRMVPGEVSGSASGSRPGVIEAASAGTGSRGGSPAIVRSGWYSGWTRRAMPQSSTSTSPNGPTMTFDGLRSR